MLGEQAVNNSFDHGEDERRFIEAAFSILQYYFFDVYLTIMAVPRAGVLVGSS